MAVKFTAVAQATLDAGTPAEGEYVRTTDTKRLYIGDGTTQGGILVGPVSSAWDGDIADINLDGGTDIGAALADGDLILVDDGAAGTNRKSALSRVWTYIAGKLSGGSVTAAAGNVNLSGTNNGYVLTQDGSGNCTFAAAAGGGNVSNTGTPADGQLAVWTAATVVEGDSALTFDTATDTLAIAASGNLAFGAVTVLDDNAGTMTLSNVDALDATTETTIEAAVDTLANLTSIQGVTVTLADAGVDAILGWDDSASAYENLTAVEARAIVEAAAPDVVTVTTNATLTKASHQGRVLYCTTGALSLTVNNDTDFDAYASCEIVNKTGAVVTLVATATINRIGSKPLTLPANGRATLMREATADTYLLTGEMA